MAKHTGQKRKATSAAQQAQPITNFSAHSDANKIPVEASSSAQLKQVNAESEASTFTQPSKGSSSTPTESEHQPSAQSCKETTGQMSGKVLEEERSPQPVLIPDEIRRRQFLIGGAGLAATALGLGAWFWVQEPHKPTSAPTAYSTHPKPQR